MTPSRGATSRAVIRCCCWAVGIDPRSREAIRVLKSEAFEECVADMDDVIQAAASMSGGMRRSERVGRAESYTGRPWEGHSERAEKPHA